MGFGREDNDPEDRPSTVDQEFCMTGGREFCVRSRIFRELWVTDFASVGCQKARFGRAFWLKGVGGRRGRMALALLALTRQQLWSEDPAEHPTTTVLSLEFYDAPHLKPH
jgi:hypothetical protein